MTDTNYVFDDAARNPIKSWTKGVPVEVDAIAQLRNTASLPFIYRHVAVMPDVHLGRGSTVGSVIPTQGAVIPAAVGVDIGCGMMAVQTNLTSQQLPEKLDDWFHQITRDVPVGFNAHQTVPKECEKIWYQKLKVEYDQFQQKYPKLATKKSPAHQLGTLGGGNHFIEVCLDEVDRVWIMLHSGSRGVGNVIGRFFIERAKEEMERMFIHLPDKDLAYLVEGSEYFDDYVKMMSWAQNYALYNRRLMVVRVIYGLQRKLPELEISDVAVNCHHNYVERENHFGSNVWITRKGAVRARSDDLGIIPGSMGERSYIVRGKGNPESFHSCSHGAGRKMSRTKAKETFTLEDHVKATEGVVCRKDPGVIDETPGAYKDLDAVMAAQTDLVEVVHTLKQLICVKG